MENYNLKNQLEIIQYGGLSSYSSSSEYSSDEEYGGWKNNYTHPKTFLEVISRPFIRWNSGYPLKEIIPKNKKTMFFSIIIDITKLKKILGKEHLTSDDIQKYFFSKDLIPLLFKSSDTTIINTSLNKKRNKRKKYLFRKNSLLAVIRFKLKNKIKFYLEDISTEQKSEYKDYKEYDEYKKNEGNIAIGYMIAGRYFMVFENPSNKLTLENIEIISVDNTNNNIDLLPFSEYENVINTGNITPDILKDILTTITKNLAEFNY